MNKENEEEQSLYPYELHYVENFQQKLFHTHHAYTVIGIIDIYHFIPLSLALTLAEVHKVSGIQKLMGLFSWLLLSCAGWSFTVWWDVETAQIEDPDTSVKRTFVNQRKMLNYWVCPVGLSLDILHSNLL